MSAINDSRAQSNRGARSGRRVVITGMDTINPLGDDLQSYYDNLIAGRSGITRWRSLDSSTFQSKIGGDIGDYDYIERLSQYQDDFDARRYRHIRKLFRSAALSSKSAVIISCGAWKDANLFPHTIDPYLTSVVVAGHNFHSGYFYKNMRQFLKDPLFIDVLMSVEGVDTSLPGHITEVLQLTGPSLTVGGASASGNLAIRNGYLDIATGECERSLVVGPLFDFSPLEIRAAEVISAVVTDSKYYEHPEQASRPFDIDRTGFVYSHGVGALVLEDLDVALRRGARPYAELLGVAATSNAEHLPVPNVEMQAKTIENLLSFANVEKSQVDYINCHATGSRIGDIAEIQAIKQAFGDQAYNLKLNAPKSMLGHACWSAPIVETIGAILQMNHGKIHPTINIDTLDPEIDLDVCANHAIDHQINIMIKNAFGFGGINCASLIGKYRE